MSGIDREIILDPRHIAKHLPETPQVQRLLRRGRSAHVFNNAATMERVAQAIIEGGEFTIDTTSSPALDPAKSEWDFVEVWIDPMLSPPYILHILLLLGDPAGSCRVYDPGKNYKLVFSSATYDEAQTWLLEDEYEPVEGRLSASEL